VAACCTGDLFILVYSVDIQESFDEVRRLLAEIYEANGQNSGLGAPATRPRCVGDAACSGVTDIPAVLRRPLGKHCPPIVTYLLQDLVETMPQCVSMVGPSASW